MPTNARNMAAARGAPRPMARAATAARPSVPTQSGEPTNRRLRTHRPGLTAGPSGALPAGVGLPDVNVGAVSMMPMHTTAQLRQTGLLNHWGPIIGDRPSQAVMAFHGVEVETMDGLLDSVVGIAKSVVPKNTVVGKLLGGDVKGAAKDATKIVAKGATRAGAQIDQQITPFQPEPIYASLAPQNTQQKWMLAGAGVLGIALIFSIARRRGAF